MQQNNKKHAAQILFYLNTKMEYVQWNCVFFQSLRIKLIDCG